MAKPFRLTDKEHSAIQALEKVAKQWPESLWLFSAGGILFVMRLRADGERALTDSGGMDSDYIVGESIQISNDGGDF